MVDSRIIARNNSFYISVNKYKVLCLFSITPQIMNCRKHRNISLSITELFILNNHSKYYSTYLWHDIFFESRGPRECRLIQ